MKNLPDQEQIEMDKGLIILLKNGDEKTCKSVYKNHWRMVLNYVTFRGGSEADAEDVYQDGIIDFFEMVKRDDFVLTSTIKIQIFNKCRSRWQYKVRERKKRGEKGFSDFENEVAGDDENEVNNNASGPFEEENEGVELPDDEQLKDAIVSLGEPCRTLLIGYYYERLTMVQLAEKLNLRNDKVAKQQKFRCLERIRRKFL